MHSNITAQHPHTHILLRTLTHRTEPFGTIVEPYTIGYYTYCIEIIKGEGAYTMKGKKEKQETQKTMKSCTNNGDKTKSNGARNKNICGNQN